MKVYKVYAEMPTRFALCDVLLSEMFCKALQISKRRSFLKQPKLAYVSLRQKKCKHRACIFCDPVGTMIPFEIASKIRLFKTFPLKSQLMTISREIERVMMQKCC